MKRIHRFFLFAVLIVSLSCCDLLNKPQPTGAVDINSLNSLAGYEALLNGAYNGLQNYGGRLIYWNDIMTAFVNWHFSFADLRQIAFSTMSPNNGVIGDFWDQMYKSINETNIIIANIDNLENATKKEKDNILGQAHFLRALMYYYLVQYYAKPWGAKKDNSQLGVPLNLKPVTTTDDFEDLKRASVKDVYDQIIKDLKAADGLKISNTSSAKATNVAVTALRARIALIQERWDDAATLANDVISANGYQLSSDVTDYFRNEFGPESIFEIANTTTDSPGDGNTSISTVYNRLGRSGVKITDAYRDTLKKIITPDQKATLQARNQKAVDTRITELLVNSDGQPATINNIDSAEFTSKYEDYVNVADNDPVLRLSEMILTKAEALAEENGVNQNSIDLLNEIRMRAIKVKTQSGDAGDESLIKFTTGNFKNKQELINAILRERSVELSYEGHLKTDLRRHHLDVGGVPWNANKLVFPIPQSQLDTSPDMNQNPGY